MAVSNRRIRLMMVVVILALIVGAGIFVSVKTLDKPKVISDATRETLKKGECSDQDLRQAKEVNENVKPADNAQYVTALQDLGNCYVLKNNYTEAANTFTKLADYYKQQNDSVKESQTRSVVLSLEETAKMPKESPKEVYTDEPLSN